jgi:hypothetical protein
MNLIQIQDQLKSDSVQQIMAYANGANPDVPPFLALAELNRRKRISQSQQEAPKETVKEKMEKEATEQGVNLLQAQQAKQQQATQQMQAQAGQASQQIPEGTPQPQAQEEAPAMAAGGIARLPVGGMFNYRDGGIVAFNDGELVESEMSGSAPMKRGKTKQEIREEMEKEREENMRKVLLAGQNERPTMQSDPRLIGQTPPEETVRGPQIAPPKPPPPQVGARPQAAPPQAGVNALPRQDMAMDMLKKSAEMVNQQPEVPQDYASAMAAAKLANPELAQPIGSKYEQMLNDLHQRDIENRGKAAEREKARARSDVAQALIDAGEATRGQRGIGALFGGFGKSMIASRAAADERAARQEALEREQDLNMAKLNSEIENLRRAEARGDVAAQQASLTKIAEIKNAMKQNQMTLQAHNAQTSAVMRGQDIDARLRETEMAQRAAQSKAQIDAANTPEVLRINKFLQENPGAEAALQKALPFTRAGVTGDTRMDAATLKEIAKVQEKFRSMKMAFQNDQKGLANIEAQEAAEIALIKQNAGIRSGGVADLPTGKTANTRIKVDANGVPIQ